MMIGVAIITCNREDMYRVCMDSIHDDWYNEIVTVNDGKGIECTKGEYIETGGGADTITIGNLDLNGRSEASDRAIPSPWRAHCHRSSNRFYSLYLTFTQVSKGAVLDLELGYSFCGISPDRQYSFNSLFQ